VKPWTVFLQAIAEFGAGMERGRHGGWAGWGPHWRERRRQPAVKTKQAQRGMEPAVGSKRRLCGHKRKACWGPGASRWSGNIANLEEFYWKRLAGASPFRRENLFIGRAAFRFSFAKNVFTIGFDPEFEDHNRFWVDQWHATTRCLPDEAGRTWATRMRRSNSSRQSGPADWSGQPVGNRAGTGSALTS